MLIVLLAAFVAALAPPGASATNVSGTISTNTTWTLANSPYVMTGDVTVSSGVTLTIEPGVVVKGNATGRKLTVNGALSAVGTNSQPITFTSSSDSAAGQWTGITFGSSSGTSSLKYVNARFGGGSGVATANGMVGVSGGTLTIEDSTFSDSSVSGLAASSPTGTGSGISLTIRRSKFERNGFVGTALHGDGLYVSNAPVVVEDSAFWSNATDGAAFTIGSTYAGAAAQISGTSIWNNGRFGLYSFLDPGMDSRGPDGYIAGKPGNELYDNGTFGLSTSESWQQLNVSRTALSMDWTGTYWGPVSVIPCALGNGNPHLSYAAPDNQITPNPVPRGPVSHTTVSGGPGSWCANDYVLDTPPADEQPDLYFDPPPPSFGGIGLGQTYGCLQCQIAERELALVLDEQGRNPLHYTPWPVNTASGSLTEVATDLRLAGPGIPFVWTRSYNSRDATSGALGVGWTQPFEAKLTLVNQATGELDYHAGSGQDTHFTRVTGNQSGSATYAAKGFDGVLKRLSDNHYELTTRDQRLFTFNTAGNLTQIKPRFLPATNLAYTSGKLSSITDSAGRTITISYLASDPTLIEKVTLPDGRYVQYGYTNGHLTSVRDARGKSSTIAYNTDGYLTSIQDALPGHYQIQNVVYDATNPGQVRSEQDGSGNTISYTYTADSPYDQTTVSVPGRGDWVYRHIHHLLMSVTDPLQHTTSYRYDPMARKARITDGRGYTRRFEYDAYGNPLKDVAPASVGGFAVVRTFNATNDLLTETDGRGHTTTYTYAIGSDPAADYQIGQLKTITDRANGVSTFKYWTTTSSPAPPSDNVGLLKSVSNQRSKTSAYNYDADGNLTKITSPLGLKTTMGYDSSGRLTSRRDPRGNVPNPPAGYLTQWGYDDVDHVSSLTDANNNVTNFDFYDNELPWKVTRYENDGTPRVTSFEYDSADRLWKTTTPRSGIETRLYWPDGQLKSVDSPEHRLTSYGYDNAGRLITLVEPNGNAPGAAASDWTWTYTYDNSGNRDSLSHPDGGETSIDYDGLNRPFEWTDPVGHTTGFEYDANDNVITSTDGLNHSKHFTYDNLDRLKTAQNELGKTWSYDYFATGELQDVISPLQYKRSYGIDDDGRTTTMVDPRGNVSGANPADYTWSYGYDEAGNRKSVRDPLGNESDYVYDGLNDLTQVTDQRSNVTTSTYDSMNRLWKVTPPAAGATGTLDTVYGYDADGNLASRTDPKGHLTSWQYDLDGLRTQRTIPVVGSWNSTYDANGNLKTLETPAGSSTQTAGDGTITYGYNRMSRLTSTDYSDSTSDVTRTWDDAGRPATMSDAWGSVTYTFDAANRLSEIDRTSTDTGLDGFIHYAYDDAGQMTHRTGFSGQEYQSFDDDGRLIRIFPFVDPPGHETTFGYDAADNLTSSTLPSGYVETRTFDRAGRLTGVDNAKSETSLSKFLWTLDPAGNPTKVQTTRAGTNIYDAHEYDARNRLAASCFGVGASASDCTGAANEISYGYDKVNNRVQDVRTGNVGNTGTTTYTYNDADQLTETDGASTTTFTYDPNGNQATAGGRTFTYDLANELVSTALAGTTASYGYDGDGRRVVSTRSDGPDLRMRWDPQAPSGIPELESESSVGGTGRTYLQGPLGPVSEDTSGSSYYYLHDPRGNVTDVTDATGAAQWRYSYEAYGSQREATDVSGSAPVNPTRFEGQYLDSETSLYHLRARQYDPTIGRFDALDPIESPLGAPYAAAYVYANAQPTVLIDPLGLDVSFFGINVPTPSMPSFSGIGGAISTGVSAGFNFGAAVANRVTFGGSNWVLGQFGIHPDTSSFSYRAGDFAYRNAGDAAMVAMAFGMGGPETGCLFGLAAEEELGSGLAHTVAFETRLAESLYPGISRGVHFQAANANLLAAMDSDPAFSALMEALVPGIRSQLIGNRSIARAPPSGWTWHHGPEPGVMQLVPRVQHEAAGVFQALLHPGGRGGFSIWG